MDQDSARPARGLLLSAYDAYSHRQWRTQLTEMFPRIEWTVLTLPPRHFRWRIRGNSLSWAFKHHRELTDNHDFLLCTSMTDLAALRGFVPSLARLPTAVYFHENQFAYPERSRQVRDLNPQLVTLYTALCADLRVFNSHYNHRSFLQGAGELLHRMPDEVPAGLIDELEQARVIPVPLADSLYQSTLATPSGNDRTVLEVVWNHRQEYDKGPLQLLEIVRRVTGQELPVRLHIVGQQFRTAPAEFTEISERLQRHHERLGLPAAHDGFVRDRDAYHRLLRYSDVVLSTADHDFQGLSMLEGAACGSTPLAPRRLVYPEYLPPDCLYGGCGDPVREADAAAQRLRQWAECRQEGGPLPRAGVDQYRATAVRPAYEALLRDLGA